MAGPQFYIFLVLAVTLALFIWGRWRYDVVALMALLAVVVGGLVPAASAFAGFGHPAVITVAAVLVISRALQNSGIVGWIARWLEAVGSGPNTQVAAVTALVALLSGFMNNVGALALLLPVVVQIAKRSGRSPAQLLMPLAFGSLLGGLVTMVGTPPNIIVASFRAEAAGAPFGMFDFTPVGLIIAVVGVAFISLAGWRLIPVREAGGEAEHMFEIAGYITEVTAPPKSGLSGTRIGDLLAVAGDGEVSLAGLIRRGKRLAAPRLDDVVRINDHLLLQGSAEAIEEIVKSTPLKLVGNLDFDPKTFDADSGGLLEAVVTPASGLIKRSITQAGLEARYGLHLLAMARHGRPIRDHLRQVKIRAGDVLLLQGDAAAMPEALANLGCLPLSARDLSLHRTPSLVPLLILIAAIGLGVSGLMSLTVAFTAGVVALVVSGGMTARELYNGVDWPIIVLLGAMVPVGLAMESSGANVLLANGIAGVAELLPPWGIVALILVAAMVLSDVMNNAATAILMAQLSVQVAERLQVNQDPLLMAVAIGSSCAFLTPIGHQSNVLVMGPAGYRFGDYWRLGLPLEIIIVFVAVPMILWVWPL